MHCAGDSVKIFRMLEKEKLDALASVVESLGVYAKERQKVVTRTFKEDGSVLTEADLEISRKVQETALSLFPDCSFVSEEYPPVINENAPYTFILDPVDGTDVYSQGLPTFAVALGVLDERMQPVGAYIATPRFGRSRDSMFIRLDPGGDLMIDGEKFVRKESKDHVEQCMIGSKCFYHYDVSRFSGKFRSFGSTIIHMICPVVFSHISAAVVQSCFVWDVAPAHAVLKAAGMDAEYIDGEKFEYTKEFVFEKQILKKDLFAGTKKGIEELRVSLIPL